MMHCETCKLLESFKSRVSYIGAMLLSYLQMTLVKYTNECQIARAHFLTFIDEDRLNKTQITDQVYSLYRPTTLQSTSGCSCRNHRCKERFLRFLLFL